MRYQAIIMGAALLISACNKSSPSAYFTLSSATAGPPQQAPLHLSEIDASPVLQRGSAGAWDAVDVLNPSVIRYQGRLLNLYSGFNGKTWRTGVATSDDGVHWTKYSGNPVLSPGDAWDTRYIAANGAAIEWKGLVLYLYQGQDTGGVTRIGLATSDDGKHFEKALRPVLDVGERHAWDGKAVGDPYVIARGGALYLYYLGMDQHDIQRIGVAKSTDGTHWTKYAGNPVMDVGAKGTFDENGLGEPSVVFSAPFFYMIYTGRDASERRNFGYAVSADGVSWKKMSTGGLFGQRDGWNREVVCDSAILREGDGTFTVWYGGGDIARPDERIDGQIGRFRLSLTPASIADGFDASFDYEAAGLPSTAVLHGSFPVEDGSAWIGPDAKATIWAMPGAQKSIDIAGWLPVSLYRKAGIKGPISLQASINGQEVAQKTFNADETFEFSIRADVVEGMTPPLVVDLRTNHSFVPSAFSDSPDSRTLSLKVSRVLLSSSGHSQAASTNAAE